MNFETREDFLNSRKGKIGASDAPIIMGESPWSTPYKLWKQKLGIELQNEMKPHMQHGLDIEDEARLYFFTKTGIKVSPFQVKHKNISYMIASLDGMSECGDVIVEIKSPSKEDHEFVKKNNMPPKKYWPQLQHQIECKNPKECYYLSYYKDDPFLLSVERDQNYIDSLVGMEADFFHCMSELIAPELTDKDYTTRTDSQWTIFCMEYRKYQDQIKEMEKKLDDTKNKIIELSEGKNCTGSGISVCQVVRKGNINYNSIPELANVDLERYRKEPSKYWKINIGK